MPRRPPVQQQPDPIRSWREARDMTRQQVCDALAANNPGQRPIDQATIHKWEIGTLPLRVRDLRALAQVYNVPAQLLLSPAKDQAMNSETTDDLVRKLRGTVRVQGPGDTPAVIPDPLCQAAADQIEQLQTTLARLRAEFLDNCSIVGYSDEEARQMLEEVENGKG